MKPRHIASCGALVLALAGCSCGLLDWADQLRARRARTHIQQGMTLPDAFGVLDAAGRGGDWPGILAGFGCSLQGQKRTWVLSRVAKGYLIISHLEDTPFGGQGDWKQLEFADARAVSGFLSQTEVGRCDEYRSNFGRWAFVLHVGNGRVSSVGAVEYQPPD